MPNNWKVLIAQNQTTFLNDSLDIFMAYRDDSGIRTVEPIKLTLSAPIPPDTNVGNAVQPSEFPRELAEELFGAFSYALTGVADPHREITRLKRELVETKKMLSDLIAGIGRLGGNTNG